jgi:hypothetical protein
MAFHYFPCQDTDHALPADGYGASLPRLPRMELQARLQEMLGVVGDDPGDAA